MLLFNPKSLHSAGSMRALIFRSFDQARAALAVARETRQAVTLLTAPDAAARLGVDVLKSMIDQAAAAVPGADFAAVIDCGDQPGLALAALRAGWRRLVFAGTAETVAKIADLARQQGAEVMAVAPPARDFGDARDPDRAARAWLCP